MKGVPQEIRISSMEIPFIDDTGSRPVMPQSIILSGAVIDIDGKVHKFTFVREELSFVSKKETEHPFDKTTHQKLEVTLSSYARGVLKLNTIQCRFDDVRSEVPDTAELE